MFCIKTYYSRVKKILSKIIIFFFLFLASTSGSETDIKICFDIILPSQKKSNLEAVYFSDLRWTKRKLTVSFWNGDEFFHQKVKQYSTVWSEYANIEFQFVDEMDADIRIGFYSNQGSWSLVGNTSKDFSVHLNTKYSIPGRNSISMNFGWFNSNTTEEEFSRTILHEFGHALGLLHEHLNPLSGIKWNYPQAYSHFLERNNWSKEEVDNNVFKKYAINHTNGVYDPDSIMHYSIPKELTLDGFAVGFNNQLSAGDKIVISSLYPKITSPTPTKIKKSL